MYRFCCKKENYSLLSATSFPACDNLNYSKTGLNVVSKTRYSSRFAAMLQNKLYVFVARFTVPLNCYKCHLKVYVGARVAQGRGDKEFSPARMRKARDRHVCRARFSPPLGFLGDHQCSCVLFYCRYSVENAYLEEKEDTCNALGEVAENSG